MSGSKMEMMVREHLVKLDDLSDYGDPLLPAVAAYLNLIVGDDVDLLLLSSVDRSERTGRLLGFTGDLMFLLTVRSVIVDDRSVFEIEGPVLPLSALRSIRLRSESKVAWPQREAVALPSADLLVDGIDELIHVGWDGAFKVPRGYEPDETARTWGRLFEVLRKAVGA